MKCPECGKNNADQYAFCVDCGAHLGSPAVAAPFEHGDADHSLEPRAESPATPGSARLRVDSGPVDRGEFTLDQPVLTIGRRVGNDIVIQDTNVSRQHARLLRQDAGYAIEDTDSANGTLVNDERVEGIRPIHDGDVILIGDARFVFELADARAPLEETRAVPLELYSEPSELQPEPSELQAEPKVDGKDRIVPAEPWLIPPPPIMVRARRDSNADLARDEGADRPASETVGPEPSDDRAREAVRPASETGDHGSGGLAGIRTGVADVGRDFRSTQAGLEALAERLTALEGELDRVGEELAPFEALARGPQAQALRDLDSLLGELAAIDRGTGAQELAQTLDELAREPRDIELLRQLSERAESLNDVLRLHGRLAALAPEAREALTRIVS